MIIPLTLCVFRQLLHTNVIFGNHRENIIYTVSLTNTVELIIFRNGEDVINKYSHSKLIIFRNGEDELSVIWIYSL